MINSAKYQAPEVYGLLWHRLADSLIYLYKQIEDLPKEKRLWEIAVLSVFSDEKFENIVDI